MNYSNKHIESKQKALNSKASKWGRKILLTLFHIVLIAFISLICVGIAAGIGVFRGIIDTSPEITSNDVAPVGYSTFVYDIEGNQMGQLVTSNSNRIPVTMENIPSYLGDAFVALEDERFRTHNGIDFQGLLRAGYQFIVTGGDQKQGASTITQQLLKNTIFTDWVTESNLAEQLKRKIQEQYLALEISKVLSKDEILLRYMNTINLSQNTLGVESASLRYFGKSVNELTLSECAVIAAITQNPSYYNPISYPENNAKRRQTCLENMLELGFITQAEYNTAMADDVYSRMQVINVEYYSENSATSYYMDAVTDAVYADLLAAGYSTSSATSLLYSGGLKIHTPMDPQIQAIADAAIADPDNFPSSTNWMLNYELSVETASGEMINHSKEMLQSYFRGNGRSSFNLIFSSHEEGQEAIDIYKEAVLSPDDTIVAENINFVIQPQISLTIADQSTGYVTAVVGGRGDKVASRTFNRAVSSYRQPGSTFKVLSAFVPAIDSAGYTLATTLNDAPFNYETGTPVSNWYSGYRGLASFRTAIQNSMNIISVKALTLITPKLGYDYLLNFGFTSLVESEYINGEIKSDIIQSTALGGITVGVSNLELNAAYAAIANNGAYNEPKFYTKVFDYDGNLLLDNTNIDSRQIIKETTAYLITDAMKSVVTAGTGTVTNFSRTIDIAGKTGTTSDYNDVWFCGYTPYYTASVWVGYDNNVKLNSTEQNLAKKLWRVVMEEIHTDLPAAKFEAPAGIVSGTVCSRSGKLGIPGVCDASLRSEIFAAGTVPTSLCDAHYQGSICQYSNLIATELCPFQVPGILELIPTEPAILQAGSTNIIQNADGSSSVENEQSNATCQHDAAFFTDPNYPFIIEQQRNEIISRTQSVDVVIE